MTYRHTPVLLEEVLSHLNVRRDGIYVDCTIGGTGHARRICELIHQDGLLIGIDQDKDAIDNAQQVFRKFGSTVRLIHDNFSNLPHILVQLGINSVDGILLDLGLSLHHIKDSQRGFSFNEDEPLDMRMDVTRDITAAHLVNTLSESALRKLFFSKGEERWAGRIAAKIVSKRTQKAIRTSAELVQIICQAVPPGAQKKKRIHPATQTFMALRIAVNKELENLKILLDAAPHLLSKKGRICVISFHSLEDRIVKHRLRKHTVSCVCPPGLPVCGCKAHATMRCLTPRVILPAAKEMATNAPSRGAKMRVYEKK